MPGGKGPLQQGATTVVATATACNQCHCCGGHGNCSHGYCTEQLACGPTGGKEEKKQGQACLSWCASS